MKKRLFRILLLIYTLILISVAAYFIAKLHHFLTAYEASVPENTVEKLIAEIREGDLSDVTVYLANGEMADGSKPFMELTKVRAYLVSVLRAEDVSWQIVNSESDGTREVYHFSSGGEKRFRLTIVAKDQTEPYGLADWEGESLELSDHAIDPTELFFRVPSYARVYVDGSALDESYRTGEEEAPLPAWVSEQGYLEQMPVFYRYAVRGIFSDPDIRVTDEAGNYLTVSLEEGGVCTASFEPPEGFTEEAEALAAEIIPVWGRYFSKDGSYDAVRRYFVPGSPVDRYVPNVDISWMQAHTGVTFAEERVDDIRYYGDTCFACDVHFLQTILHADPSRQREWETDLTWYFVRPDTESAWKIYDLEMRTNTQQH